MSDLIANLIVAQQRLDAFNASGVGKGREIAAAFDTANKALRDYVASLRTELQEARRRIEEFEASGNPDGEEVCCGICTPTCAELQAGRAALAAQEQKP